MVFTHLVCMGDLGEGVGEGRMLDVLLSLSGGKQYRSNNITKEDGTMVFTHLVCMGDLD